MSIGESIENAWHKHPYIIMGVGGVIIVYLLWPSSSSSSSGAATSTDPYGEQLAAETALSQTQLAEQAALAQTNASETVAVDADIAQSNEAIAQSNAAAIVSYNQTAQTGIQAEGALAVAQTTAGSTDFNGLLSVLNNFGTNATQGASEASANGLDAYLTSIGAMFSDTIDGNTFNATNTTQSGYGGAAAFAGGVGIILGPSSNVDSGVTLGPSGAAETYGVAVDAANTPFTQSDNLMASLWSQALASYNTNEASIIKTIPTITPATSPILTGNVQPIPSPVG
jgi:hypothetical protein